MPPVRLTGGSLGIPGTQPGVPGNVRGVPGEGWESPGLGWGRIFLAAWAIPRGEADWVLPPGMPRVCPGHPICSQGTGSYPVSEGFWDVDRLDSAKGNKSVLNTSMSLRPASILIPKRTRQGPATVKDSPFLAPFGTSDKTLDVVSVHDINGLGHGTIIVDIEALRVMPKDVALVDSAKNDGGTLFERFDNTAQWDLEQKEGLKLAIVGLPYAARLFILIFLVYVNETFILWVVTTVSMVENPKENLPSQKWHRGGLPRWWIRVWMPAWCLHRPSSSTACTRLLRSCPAG